MRTTLFKLAILACLATLLQDFTNIEFGPAFVQATIVNDMKL